MLKTEIENAKRLVTTDRVQISIGEIASMYSSGELDIIPDFQRLFRWSIEKKTSFIESIFIGIPVPPAFAYENGNGTWELIDGLQRISTVLEFMGVLRDVDNPGKFRSSTLTAAKYLPSLDGVSWDTNEGSDGGETLDKTLQLFFRRARIEFQVLKNPSDPQTKFDLFQRLNRGGAYANAQEVRSCMMVLANPEFTRQIREIAELPSFTKIFKISEPQRLDQTNVEYAVRAIVHTFRNFTRETDVQEFLDRSIVDILLKERPNKVVTTITWAVEALFRIFGEQALVPNENALEGIANRFSLRALEAIVVGIARNKSEICNLAKPDNFIKARMKNFWQQEEVVSMSASGLRGTVRIQRSVPFGANWFKPNG